MTLPFLARVQLRVFAVQFLLGTYLNLFVNLSALDLVGLSALVLHILLGFGLVVVSVRMIPVAIRTGSRRGIAWTAVSAVGVIGAFLAGSSFTFGDESPLASFVMALGFFLGLISAGALLGRPAPGGQDTDRRQANRPLGASSTR